MNNDTQNQPKITKPFKRVDSKELKSIGFWLNQVFLVLSTIFGVYLAAQSGLEQALKFDTFSKMEDNYYLRTSLYDELKDNADNLSQFADLLAKSPAKSELVYNKPTIEKYIWHTMQNSSSTLQTPSEFLTGVRRFYTKSQFIVDAAIDRKIAAKRASKELKNAVEIIENQILPNLNTSALRLKKELHQHGIDVETIK